MYYSFLRIPLNSLNLEFILVTGTGTLNHKWVIFKTSVGVLIPVPIDSSDSSLGVSCRFQKTAKHWGVLVAVLRLPHSNKSANLAQS